MSPLRQKLADLYYLAMHHGLRHAPLEVASALGGLLVRTNVRLNRPEIIAGARRNLARHRPDLSAGEIDRAIWRFADNVGRHMGECSGLDRMIPEDRIEISGHQHIRALAGRRPVLGLQLHTGNWEVFVPALTGTMPYPQLVATFTPIDLAFSWNRNERACSSATLSGSRNMICRAVVAATVTPAGSPTL